MAKTANLEAGYAVVTSELTQRQAELKNREPIQKAIAEYKTIVDMGGGFTEDLGVITSLAEELGIEVGPITHEGSSITFTCQADSYTTFREYKVTLEESGRFLTPVTPPEGYPYITSGPIKLEPKPSQ